MSLSFSLLLVILVAAVGKAAQPESLYKVEILHVLFRHGDRTPDVHECYPTDPFKPMKFDPPGRGHLTVKGENRSTHLGELLRKTYDTFLGDYQESSIYAYSTASSRTKKTLEWVLKTLYPNKPNDQIIPTHSNPPNTDHFYLTLLSPKFKALLAQVKERAEVKAELQSLQPFYDFLASKTGLPMNLEYAMLIDSTFRAQQSYGLTLPPWTAENDTLNNLVKNQNLFYKLYTYLPEMKKIAFGPLLKELLSNIDHPNSKKIVLYSVHDLNVMLFIRSHGIQTNVTLEYGMTVILEKLRGQDGQVFIRIKFYPGSEEAFTILKMEGCEELCPYAKYLELVKPLVPNDEEIKSYFENGSFEGSNAFVNNKCE